VRGNGNQPVQTFVWSSWLSPGFYGPKAWINKDISGLTHEITEWANDPFNNNTVQPWTAAHAPQYGCADTLETGDPTVGAGFSAGLNTFDPDLLPNGKPNMFVEHRYHIQDEAYLSWFMRTDSVSQTNQSGVGGRHSLMGDLSPMPELHSPAPTC